MPTYRIVKEVRASPAVVWSVLADYPGMTKWAGARKVTIEQPGIDVPNGIGTTRALKSARDDPRAGHRFRAGTAHDLQRPIRRSRS
jgi:hypothetical protein